MNNLDRILTLLSEKEREIIPKELSDRAQKAGVSIDDIRKCNTVAQVERLIDKKYREKEKSEPKEKLVRGPKKPKMTNSQYNRLCRDAAESWISDNPDYEGEDVWYDMAEGMLYDPEIMAYLNYSYYKAQGKPISKQIAKEILADDIYSFADKIKSKKGK